MGHSNASLGQFLSLFRAWVVLACLLLLIGALSLLGEWLQRQAFRSTEMTIHAVYLEPVIVQHWWQRAWQGLTGQRLTHRCFKPSVVFTYTIDDLVLQGEGLSFPEETGTEAWANARLEGLSVGTTAQGWYHLQQTDRAFLRHSSRFLPYGLILTGLWILGVLALRHGTRWHSNWHSNCHWSGQFHLGVILPLRRVLSWKMTLPASTFAEKPPEKLLGVGLQDRLNESRPLLAPLLAYRRQQQQQPSHLPQQQGLLSEGTRAEKVASGWRLKFCVGGGLLVFSGLTLVLYTLQVWPPYPTAFWLALFGSVWMVAALWLSALYEVFGLLQESASLSRGVVRGPPESLSAAESLVERDPGL